MGKGLVPSPGCFGPGHSRRRPRPCESRAACKISFSGAPAACAPPAGGT